jgi:hypothetical protein
VIPEGSKSLEQAMINPQPHEGGELAKNPHNVGMVVLSKKSPPVSHPLDAEVVETKRHQGVGIAARRGHALKGPKNGENREILVKKGERNSKNGCWLERELEALKGEDSRVMITCESRWEFQWLFFPYHADLTLFVRS